MIRANPRRVRWVLPVAVLALVPAPAPAAAPRPTLRFADVSQSGIRHETWWSKPQGGGICLEQRVTFVPEWPSTNPDVGRNHPIGIRLEETRRPTASANAWSEVDEGGAPIGDPVPVPVQREAVRDGSGTIVRWRLRLLPAYEGPHHLSVLIQWPDRECATREGGYWGFRFNAVTAV